MELSEFLMNPAVMMVILTIGLVGLLVELFSPGVGLGAFIGLASFAVFSGLIFMPERPVQPNRCFLSPESF